MLRAGALGRECLEPELTVHSITMSEAALLPSIYAVSAVPLFWIAVGFAGLAYRGPRALHARIFFALGAAGGLTLALAAYPALSGSAQAAVLPLGLPDLPFHVRLDGLSALFLIVLGAAAAGISLYAGDYF